MEQVETNVFSIFLYDPASPGKAGAGPSRGNFNLITALAEGRRVPSDALVADDRPALLPWGKRTLTGPHRQGSSYS